jgi:hypothetical protein
VVLALLFEQFGSVVAEHGLLLMFAVLTMVLPGASLTFAWTTRLKLTVLPEARVVFFLFVQVMVPVEPTAGVVQVHPVGVAKETKVAPVGMVSVNVSEPAAVGVVAGPLLVTTCV